MSLRALVMAAAALSAASLLGGCAYDYLQHTDRVGYSAGDAVAHNLAQETINPSKRSMYEPDDEIQVDSRQSSTYSRSRPTSAGAATGMRR